MKGGPQVSVILPVFNGETWLGHALDSICEQTFTDHEVIVVDNGSTDASLEIALERGLASDGRIRIVSISNSGVATARNAGMAAALGHYFAFLDRGDVWLPHHLELAMNAFEHDPDLGLVHANLERVDTSGLTAGVPTRHWAGIDDAFEAIALRHEHVALSTTVVSREVIKVAGQFDERFNGLGCEDLDLWLRIADRFRIRYLNHVGTRCTDHAPGMISDTPLKHQARQLLVSKLGQSERGRGLLCGMEAMVESDLGLEYLTRRRFGGAIRQQWLAIRIDPGARILWKRLLRVSLTTCLSLFSPKRHSATMRGAP